jgi:competence protein ComEA
MHYANPMRGARAAAALLLLAVAGTLAAAADAPAPPKAPAAPIDLNAATADELATLPGVGAAIAQRIVQWREQNGPFASVEDLMKVKGIGEKSLEKLRPYVKVAPKKR